MIVLALKRSSEDTVRPGVPLRLNFATLRFVILGVRSVPLHCSGLLCVRPREIYLTQAGLVEDIPRAIHIKRCEPLLGYGVRIRGVYRLKVTVEASYEFCM